MLIFQGYYIEIESTSTGYRAKYYQLPDNLLPGLEPTFHNTEVFSKITTARIKAKSDIRHLNAGQKINKFGQFTPNTQQQLTDFIQDLLF